MADKDVDAPDPARILKLARAALTSSEFRKKFSLVDYWGVNEFYSPQKKFFADGKSFHQRLLRGGNQVGKSFAAAFETALHLTGNIQHGGQADDSKKQYAAGWSGQPHN
jgi:hypothetical protein